MDNAHWTMAQMANEHCHWPFCCINRYTSDTHGVKAFQRYTALYSAIQYTAIQLYIAIHYTTSTSPLCPGFEIFIWVGQGASQSEKVSAFPYAQKYLKDYKRPPVLPLTRYSEGKEPSSFLELFGPPEAQGACASCCVVS